MVTSTDKKTTARLALVALGCLGSWFDLAGAAGLHLPFEIIGAVTTIIGGWPVLREALGDLRSRRVTLSLSMSIGILAALGTGETFVSSLMTLVVLVSEEMEHLTVDRARASVRNMISELPDAVDLVQPDGSVRRVPLSCVAVGDVVRIPAGGLVPVDGVIAVGSGAVDEAQITGESLPARKRHGDAVFAGSVVQAATLDVRATAVGDATVYGRVVTTVQRAEGERAPVEALADRVARAVVYFAFASSGATLAATGAVSNAVSVLVVAGACGIAAGTPLAIVGGIGRAARGGCVIKGGQHLEALASVDTVVFDKTGTLTRGRPEVIIATALDPAAFPADRLYAVAHAAESRSDHPMARAVAAFAEAQPGAAMAAAAARVEDHREVQGLGVRCRVDGAAVLVGNAAFMELEGVDISPLAAVNATAAAAAAVAAEEAEPNGAVKLPVAAPAKGETVPAAAAAQSRLHAVSSRVCVAVDGRLVGVLLVADAVRPEAAGVLHYLRRQGIRPILLSGDRRDVVEAVAADLGIREALAEQSPLDKAAFMEGLVASGRRVAMVGDGINDAAAMAKATVGVAMGQSSALTQQVADVVILHDTLERLQDAIQVSKQARRIIIQNVVGTIVVDVLGSLAAFKGLLDPVMAASFHGLWDVSFILNSGRLLMHTPKAAPERDGAGECAGGGAGVASSFASGAAGPAAVGGPAAALAAIRGGSSAFGGGDVADGGNGRIGGSGRSA